jgi:hypothetical protein
MKMILFYMEKEVMNSCIVMAVRVIGGHLSLAAMTDHLKGRSMGGRFCSEPLEGMDHGSRQILVIQCNFYHFQNHRNFLQF